MDRWQLRYGGRDARGTQSNSVGTNHVSKSSSHTLRFNALSLALAGALGLGLSMQAQAQSVRPGAGAAAPTINLDALKTQPDFTQFIVKYRDADTSTLSLNTRQSSIARAAASAGIGLAYQRQLATGADLVAVDGGKPINATDAARVMEALAKSGNVEYVEPDLRMFALLTPNDTRYGEQWDYSNPTGGMNLPAAWDIGTGTGVVVAVIDTGITPHSDLSANIVAGYDFITSTFTSRDGNGRDSNPNDEGDWSPTAGECYTGSPVSNSSWHGTHVAGTIAAVTNNSLGVAGVAFGAKVQPVRVLGRCGGTLSDIADAIVWASGGTVSGIPANPTPAKVINMSLGGSGTCAATYQNAITSAVGRGTVVVVAAGNSNANAANFQPASCNNVINVAALDRNGSRAYYSNFGTSIDVAAPGGDVRSSSSNGILSTLNTGTTTQGSATYAFYQGTSMASPHVAGLAALILSKNAALTPAQVETFIKNNTRALPGTCTGGCGTGLVDALKTLQAVTGTGGGGGASFTNTTDFTIADNATVESPITVSGVTGNAPSTLKVSVDIKHTYIGDLKVDLVAPDGSVYVLHNRAGGSADNILTTYTVNASSEVANGTWKLRVNDNATADTGYIDSWGLQF